MICFFTGHDYRPRYSEKMPKSLTFKGTSAADLSNQLEAAKIKIYEGDVCVTCGSVVNKPFRLPEMNSLWEIPTES